MIKKLKMTVLTDNLSEEPLSGEWGLCILIDADGKKILLDTGASELFAENARRLKIDPAQVEIGVLSHAHYDHADGLDTFFACNDHAPFLVREGSGENCFGIKEDGSLKYIGIGRGILERNKDRIRFVRGVWKIAEGIWLVGHRKMDYSKIALRNNLYLIKDGCRCPDDFAHEQSLVIETEKGLVVFNSCSHTGIRNILEDVKELLGREDVTAYAGGLHLYNLSDDELSELSAEIAASGITKLLTGHCTGEHAFDYLRGVLGDRIVQFRSGFEYTFTA